MAMLDGEPGLTLDTLNRATQAWVEQEYHRSPHSELATTPLARYLEGPTVARPCPDAATLRAAFRIEVARRQRRADGTVSLAGLRLEIPARYQALETVHLRYARWDLAHVDLVDPHSGAILSPLRPLDKAANAGESRRARVPAATSVPPPGTPSGIAPLLRQLLEAHAATGLPPAYLPLNPSEDIR
jgi:hypothetical protein